MNHVMVGKEAKIVCLCYVHWQRNRKTKASGKREVEEAEMF